MNKKVGGKSFLFLHFCYDNIMILLILILAMLSSNNVLLCQIPSISSIFWSYDVWLKLALTILNAFYIVGNRILNRKQAIPFSVINVYCFLAYLCIPSFLFRRPSLVHYFAHAFAWPLTFVSFVIYSSKQEFSSAFRFTYALGCIMAAVAMYLNLANGEFANQSYISRVVALCPFALFLFKRRARWIFTAVVTVLVVLSAKRGVFLAIGLGYVCYYICKSSQSDNKGQKWIMLIAGFLVMVLALIAFSDNEAVQRVLDRLQNSVEDGGSGRVDGWNIVFEEYRNSPIIKKVIGHGYQTVAIELQLFGGYRFAHNSYIEALYDVGIIGLTWLIVCVLAMAVYLLRMVLKKSIMAPTALFAMSIVLIFSMVSFFFEESGNIIMIAAYWGAFQGVSYRKEEPGPTPLLEFPRYRYVR